MVDEGYEVGGEGVARTFDFVKHLYLVFTSHSNDLRYLSPDFHRFFYSSHTQMNGVVGLAAYMIHTYRRFTS